MIVWQCCKQINQILTCGDTLREVGRDNAFPIWQAGGTVLQGWARVRQGQAGEGLTLIHQGINDWRASGVNLILPYYLALLAEAYGRAGRPDEGLHELTGALALVEATGERWYEAELHRLKGELMLQQYQVASVKLSVSANQKTNATNPQPLTPNPQLEAEVCFLKAIEIARQQQAKSLELRAVMSLGRLWQRQGKKEEARQMLAEVYNWFTEGFDTRDLQEAKALIEDLEARGNKDKG
jgi:predicted ATPase